MDGTIQVEPQNRVPFTPQPRNGRYERRGVWKWAYRDNGDWMWDKDDDPSRFLKGHGPHPDAMPVYEKGEDLVLGLVK